MQYRKYISASHWSEVQAKKNATFLFSLILRMFRLQWVLFLSLFVANQMSIDLITIYSYEQFIDFKCISSVKRK